MRSEITHVKDLPKALINIQGFSLRLQPITSARLRLFIIEKSLSISRFYLKLRYRPVFLIFRRAKMRCRSVYNETMGYRITTTNTHNAAQDNSRSHYIEPEPSVPLCAGSRIFQLFWHKIPTFGQKFHPHQLRITELLRAFSVLFKAHSRTFHHYKLKKH